MVRFDEDATRIVLSSCYDQDETPPYVNLYERLCLSSYFCEYVFFKYLVFQLQYLATINDHTILDHSIKQKLH